MVKNYDSNIPIPEWELVPKDNESEKSEVVETTGEIPTVDLGYEAETIANVSGKSESALDEVAEEEIVKIKSELGVTELTREERMAKLRKLYAVEFPSTDEEIKPSSPSPELTPANETAAEIVKLNSEIGVAELTPEERRAKLRSLIESGAFSGESLSPQRRKEETAPSPEFSSVPDVAGENIPSEFNEALNYVQDPEKKFATQISETSSGGELEGALNYKKALNYHARKKIMVSGAAAGAVAFVGGMGTMIASGAGTAGALVGGGILLGGGAGFLALGALGYGAKKAYDSYKERKARKAFGLG